jgi:hypothetical protein
MKRRVIGRLMQERVPGIKSHNGYFFRADFDHVLQGVLFDYVPTGLYVTNFRFPLFDPFGPNLLYSNRTPGSGFVGKDDSTEEGLIELVFSVPELRGSLLTEPPISLNEFMDYLQRLQSENARFMHAAALTLLCQDEDALRIAEAIDPRKIHPTRKESYELLLTSLRQGSSEALSFFDAVRERNLRAFGLARQSQNGGFFRRLGVSAGKGE